MGKGDKKTRRGKIISNSYGVTRPRKKFKKEQIVEEKPVKPEKPKKEKAPAAKTTRKTVKPKEKTEEKEPKSE